MLVVASFDPTDLSGLSSVVAIVLLLLGLVGLFALIIVASFLLEDFRLSRIEQDRFALEPGPVDRGTALPCWCNDDLLKGVAKQHQIDGTPAKVEKSNGFGISLSLPFGGKGKADRGSKVTVEPYDDSGELILRLLAALDKKGELNQTADRISVHDLQVDPLLALSAGPESAASFFEQWLDKHYPNGLGNVSSDDLAQKLAEMSAEFPEEQLRERIADAHLTLAKNEGSVILLEGEWDVAGDDGDLLLERTDLRVAAHDQDVPKSLPMPAGVSIHVRVEGELTRHGKNCMVGVTRPIRGCVMGTVRQHVPSTGCLEIAPIAIFQRLSTA
jgi:hypothetical protein